MRVSDIIKVWEPQTEKAFLSDKNICIILLAISLNWKSS